MSYIVFAYDVANFSDVAGRFLVNNWKQAHDCIADLPSQLATAMTHLGIKTPNTFEAWLIEEQTYLERVHEVPVEDVLKTDYVRQLKKLYKAKYGCLLRSIHLLTTAQGLV